MNSRSITYKLLLHYWALMRKSFGKNSINAVSNTDIMFCNIRNVHTLLTLRYNKETDVVTLRQYYSIRIY